MTFDIKGPYHDTDDRVYDVLNRRKNIVDDIVSYMKNFKANGTTLLQNLNLAIQEVNQMQKQNLTQTASSILQWIVKHVGLVNCIEDFYNHSINDIIKQFSDLSSDIQKKIDSMESELSSEEENFNSVFNKYKDSLINYNSVHDNLVNVQKNIDRYQEENNTSKVERYKKDFETQQDKFLKSEKDSYEKWNSYVNSKFQIAAEEEHYIVKWEQLDREVYQKIQELLQDYAEKVTKIANEIRELSQESLGGGLDNLRKECDTIPKDPMDNFNYTDSFKILKKKYYYDETLPDLDFNIFNFLTPQEVFSFDLNTRGSFLMAKQNYTPTSLEEIEVKENDILRFISTAGVGSLKVRNETTGEIGIIYEQYVKPIDNSIRITREIRRIHRDNPRNGPEYVLVLSEPDPETHCVRCLFANGTISEYQNDALDPPE